MPTLFVVAGPNGAGKSSLTKSGYFPHAIILDPDAEAHAIALENPRNAAVRAGHCIVKKRREAMAAGKSMILETTLAGRDVLRFMSEARTRNYCIELHYVRLISVEMHLRRIECRVRAGGHNVLEQDVRRRFARSMANLPSAMAIADKISFYTNDELDAPLRERATAYFPDGVPPNWVAEAWCRLSEFQS